MSDHAPFEKKPTTYVGNEIFGPARASMRTRLGELVDVYMDAKIKIAKKLSDKIAGEHDVDNLMKLRAMLNDVIFAEDDITQLNGKIQAFMAMLQVNAKAFLALRKEWMNGHMDSYLKS